MKAYRAILLSLLCLLTFSTSAAAECAWVLWSGINSSKTDVADWVFRPRGTYPTRHDCYRAMRANPVVAVLKDVDLEFGYAGSRPFGSDTSLVWDGNGVTLVGPLPQWWSCQPDSKKPQPGPFPWG